MYMNGDKYIYLPFGSSDMNEAAGFEGAVGVAYRIEKPEKREGSQWLYVGDIEQLGGIYDLGSGEYEIRGKGTTYGLTYYDEKVVLTGDSEYAGTYVQISDLDI